MNLSPAYLKQREEWRQEGTVEGQRLMIASLLEGRFGTLDGELGAVVESIARLPVPERTSLLLSLASRSCEELLARFERP